MDISEESLRADVEAVNSIPAVERILEAISKATGMGFAAVARVTRERWIACYVKDDINFGLKPGSELKLKTTICNEIEQSGQPVIIDHVSEDPYFKDHHTPAMYGFQSYISVPIMLKDGSFFGTLCAIDPKPAKLKDSEIPAMFELFAELIAFHLDALKKIQVSEDKNREQAALAELREQFIAILGHDLRNPLGATISSAQMLKLMHLDEASSKLVNVVYSASQRMKKLIDNIVDFAGARMGNGLAANIQLNNDMEAVLQEVIKEFAQSHPDTNIITNIRLLEPVYCDSNRVAQLFSNLLSNAISHGEKHQPVYVEAVTGDHEFILSIKNSGKQIPDALREHLFQPFFRGKADSREGLGLGLFIAAEITKAHDGTLSVHSDDDATVFTLRLPSAISESNTK